MRRLFLFLIGFVAAYTADAQNAAEDTDGGKAVSDSVALKEVVVESPRTVDKGDALRLMPSEVQKKRLHHGIRPVGTPCLALRHGRRGDERNNRTSQFGAASNQD